MITLAAFTLRVALRAFILLGVLTALCALLSVGHTADPKVIPPPDMVLAAWIGLCLLCTAGWIAWDEWVRS